MALVGIPGSGIGLSVTAVKWWIFSNWVELMAADAGGYLNR